LEASSSRGESLFEDVGETARLLGVGPGEGGALFERIAELSRGLGYRLGVGGRQLGEVAEGGKLGVVGCGSSTSGDELFQLLELPFRALQELEAFRGALVIRGLRARREAP